MTNEERNKLQKINALLKEVEDWRKDDNYRVDLIKWLYIKGFTLCEDLDQLTDLLDNCVVCPSNTELLTAENVDNFDNETIKRLTGHRAEYIKKLGNKKGYLLHFPRISEKGNCHIVNYPLLFNLKDLEEKTKNKPIRFVVIGALWFDRVNGNSYNVAKIIDTKTRSIYFTQFCYGYGSQYMSEARDYIRDNIYKKVDMSKDVINGGSFYTDKKTVKNHWF